MAAGAGPGDSPCSQPATAFGSALAPAALWDPSIAAQFGRVAQVPDCGEEVMEAGHRPRQISYSIRKASIGEIEAARAEGMIPAANADSASALAAVISAIGSQLEMP